MPPAQSQILRQSSLPMMAMLTGSLLLGVAYNNASPLGVRGAKAPEKAVTASPPASSNSRTGYANETVSLTLEGARNPRPAGSAYGNQTVAMGLAPIQAAPSPSVVQSAFPSLAWP